MSFIDNQVFFGDSYFFDCLKGSGNLSGSGGIMNLGSA